MNTDEVLAAIDNALHDDEVSCDAMRWTPEPAETRPESSEIAARILRYFRTGPMFDPIPEPVVVSPVADARTILADLSSVRHILAESRRTVLCRPEFVDLLRRAIAGWGLDGLWKVVGSLVVPRDKLYVLADSALMPPPPRITPL